MKRPSVQQKLHSARSLFGKEVGNESEENLLEINIGEEGSERTNITTEDKEHSETESVDSIENDILLTEDPGDSVIEKMEVLLPLVMESLSLDGKDKPMLQFFELVSENKFPLTNIAYLLWNEIVKWFDCKSTTQMRYSDETKTFWKLGW